MKLNVGTRVKMTRTGQAGTVSALLEDGMVEVKLDGGLGYLPAPPEALRLVEKIKEADSSGGKGSGIQLAFDPLFDGQGQAEAYHLYLLNGTNYKILYEIKVHTGEQKQGTKFGPLSAGEKLKYLKVPYQWLNERLTIALDVRAVVDGGTGPRHFHTLKVKPKQFFGSYRDVPELSRGAHLFTVFQTIEAASVADRNTKTSLRELTRAQVKSKPSGATITAPAPTDLQRRIDFDEVLDLHLTSLVDDPAGLPKDRALELQMEAFDIFMDTALRLDVKQVYVVHGLGNGVLKTVVHQRLKHFPFVKTFNNNHHPRFGFGATEVTFE